MTRRPTIATATLIAAIVLATVGAAGVLARFAPLEHGNGSGPVVASGDAWTVDTTLGARTIIVARNEFGERLDVRTSLVNLAPVTVTIDLERTLGDLQAGLDPACWWWPDGLAATTTGWGGEPAGERLPSTFRLHPQRQVLLDVEGSVGGGPGARPCEMDAMSSRGLDLPVRFRVAGLSRTQVVATPFVVGLSDDPETWLEPRVASAEDTMPTP